MPATVECLVETLIASQLRSSMTLGRIRYSTDFELTGRPAARVLRNPGKPGKKSSSDVAGVDARAVRSREGL